MDQINQQDVMNLVNEYGALAVKYGLDVLGALLLLIGGWIVAAWAQRAARRGLGRLKGLDATVVSFLSGIARYVIIILVLVAVLAQFGVETASILAVLGTVGLGVGLALQGTLSNIAAGIMLLVLRPFRAGDYIDAEGLAGTVNEIGLFNTELTTFDGVYLTVPNGQIWSRAILNYSRLPTRRLDVPIGIAYGDDIEKAMEVLMGLLKGDERVLGDPAPQVMVKELGDSAVVLNLRCWSKASDYWSLLFDLNKRSKETVEAAGCTIPFPQREMRIVGGQAAASG